MEEHKKKILTLVGVILIFIALIVVILSIIFKDEKINEPNKPSSNPNKVIAKEIEELKDENLFFSVQNAINNYYSMLSNKNTDYIVSILDNDYKREKNITSNNIYNVLKSDYETVNYIAKSIYYNPNSSITYYFINGYLSNLSMMEDDYQYYPNINFLIIVNENNNYYNIMPLDDNIDIENFAKNYDIKNRQITGNTLLSSYTMSEKNKLSVYITEFIDLMVYDNKRAYDMLDEETKNKYNGIDDFKNQLMDIYNYLSTLIFSFSSKEVNGEKVYSIIDDNQNKITIYEKNIMNYKIGF